MSDKPSYLGLLNAIALGETEAECYLTTWAGVTPHDGVRSVLTFIALREGEHGKAFAKRMCELGYEVRPRDNGGFDDRMAIASSCELSDREKFEKLGLVNLTDESKPDIFALMFNDRTIDIQTGALLGRYIAEERDSGRRFRACYEQLCAEEAQAPSAPAAGAPDLAGSLSRIEHLLEQLVGRLG